MKVFIVMNSISKNIVSVFENSKNANEFIDNYQKKQRKALQLAYKQEVSISQSILEKIIDRLEIKECEVIK